MNVKTGLSILNKPWLIEPSAAAQMLDLWLNMKRDGEFNYKSSEKENTTQKFFAINGVTVAPATTSGMSQFSGFAGCSVAIIPVSGPLMKSDYCGDLGTASLRSLTQMADNEDSVKCIVFAIDSPGGTVDGTKAFADTIKSSAKQTICLVDGMMCSAAYWIGSSCDEIYSSSPLDIIGSIGTMCGVVDRSKANEKDGIVVREYYATDSKDKNKMFSDAADGNGKALISEMLDPMNDSFMNTVRVNRGPKLDENTLTGKTYLANVAVKNGLVDGIKSMDEILSAVSTNTIKNKEKYTVMTAAEIKAAHPNAYADIVAEGRKTGVADERARVGSWMVFSDVDLVAVAKGIASGEDLGKVAMAELSRKVYASAGLANIGADGKAIPDINPDPNAVNQKPEEAQLAAFNAEVKKNLKKFKQ